MHPQSDDHEEPDDDDDDDLFSQIDSASKGENLPTRRSLSQRSGSISSLLDLKFPPPPLAEEPKPDAPKAIEGSRAALYAFEAQSEGTQSTIAVGETLTVVQTGPEWSWVRNAQGNEGYVPSSYISS